MELDTLINNFFFERLRGCYRQTANWQTTDSQLAAMRTVGCSSQTAIGKA